MRKQGKNAEWITPAEIIEAARHVHGRLDLDVCSTPEANALIGADRIFTREMDPLHTAWPQDAKVWMFPPPSEAGEWVYHATKQDLDTLMLLPASTATQWGQMVLGSGTVCFLKKRPVFRLLDGGTQLQPDDWMVAAFGESRFVQEFNTWFSPLGVIVGGIL